MPGGTTVLRAHHAKAFAEAITGKGRTNYNPYNEDPFVSERYIMTEQDQTSTETTDETVKEKDVRPGKVAIAAAAGITILIAGVASALIRKRKPKTVDAPVVLVEDKPAEEEVA
jgi:hypothetical protein